MVPSWPSTPIVLSTRALGLLLSLPLALACNPDEVSPLPVVPPERAIYSPPECRVAFSPDEALRPAAEIAAARWSVATGCEILVADGGIPLVAWPILFVEYTPDGQTLLADRNVGGTMRSICGLAEWNDADTEVERLHVALACDVEDAVTHEMGHALARIKAHSWSGVMASGENEDRTHVIDVGSLELVCYPFPCASFVPEAP